VVQDKVEVFQSRILDWFPSNARVFPWRNTHSPYLVMLSEVLLQQTNVEKVIEPYVNISGRWPTVQALAATTPVELQPYFKDLGLFFRSERLIDISQQILKKHNGIFPTEKEQLMKVKGIGEYAASCIVCFGYGLREAVVDTNVIRIMSRVFGFRSEKQRPRDDKKVWAFADMLLPYNDYVNYNYALLDFGALQCTHYHRSCEQCCLANICQGK